jgi:hypothetical protein
VTVVEFFFLLSFKSENIHGPTQSRPLLLLPSTSSTIYILIREKKRKRRRDLLQV